MRTAPNWFSQIVNYQLKRDLTLPTLFGAQAAASTEQAIVVIGRIVEREAAAVTAAVAKPSQPTMDGRRE